MADIRFGLRIAVLLLATLFCLTASAHNNPSFRKEFILTVTVPPTPNGEGVHLEVGPLDVPKKAIELLFSVLSDQKAAIRFDVIGADRVLGEKVQDGGKARLVIPATFTIQNVTGATAPFELEIYANVIDR